VGNVKKMIVEIANRNFVILKRLGLNIVGLTMVRPVQLDIMKIVLLRERRQMNVNQILIELILYKISLLSKPGLRELYFSDM